VAGNRRIDVSGTVFSVAGASISRLVRTQADFPQPGVLFRDLTPVLADAEALREVGTALAAAAPDATLIAGLESRGFLLGAAAAAIAGTGCWRCASWVVDRRSPAYG
jgi:adenine phosphoribosyltransferase